MMRRTTFLLLIGGMLLCLPRFQVHAAGVGSDFPRIKQYFSTILDYRTLPQEKVYLQLDNNGYFPSEKIWFKAYVFRAGTLLPTDMSKILYVELRTPDGNLWERKTLPIYNGRTYGEFNLGYVFRSGFYEVRAYTRAMLNWDAAYIYSRMVPVFRECADSLNYNKLELEPYDMTTSACMRRQPPRPLLSPQSQKQKGCILTFFPEGGHIIRNLESKVAFKLTDSDGLPLDQPVRICDNDGREVLQAKPEHEGMGCFTLSPRWTGGYAEVSCSKGKVLRFNIPASRRQGCTLSAKCEDSLRIDIEASDSLRGEMLGLSVTCRGLACFFDTLHAVGGRQTLTVPRQQLREGIEQVTLFTASGEVLAERLVWVAQMRAPLFLEVKQNQAFYPPFAPIVLGLSLKDHEGRPLQGGFSLSVQDKRGIIAEGGPDLRTDMLLCSDLKGYIHDPGWYFTEDDEVHHSALDLLMLVQGWRRYEWREMAGIDTFKVKHPIEDVQVIDGTVVDWSDRKVPVPDTDVNLILLDFNGYHNTSFGFTKTDSLGRFAIQLKDTLYDTCYAYFSATKKGKRKRYAFVLNRGFHPEPRPAEPYELKPEPPPVVQRSPAVQQKAEIFIWTDTLPKVRYLPAAKVVDKKPPAYEQPFGTRWTYMGGENAARRISTIYYNMEEETQDWLDKGNFYLPNIWEWFASINKNFYYDPNFPEDTRWYGRSVQTVYDNTATIPWNSHGTIDEFRALYVSNDPWIYTALTGIASGQDAVTFLLYTEVGNNFINTYKKGMRTAVIRGYSRVDEFYSPDYRHTDMPSPSDHRRTLYWNPEMTTDKDGKADVILYNNSCNGTELYIDAQGIAVNGEMFSNHK